MNNEAIEWPTMPLEDVLKLESGDYGGPMSMVWDHMDHGCTSIQGTCQDRAVAIAEDMLVNGWNGPPVYVRVEAPSYWRPVDGDWLPTLTNGHHRTMAAWLAGIEDIPITHDWDESDGL